MSLRCLALLALILPASAMAQLAPERELDVARALYDVGKYAEAQARVSAALQDGTFTEAQRVELLRLGALSAFNQGDLEAARAQFLRLLLLNPDLELDPFAVAPPAIRLFEQVKKDNAAQLAIVRQQLALRVEQERRAEEARQRELKAEEERRRRLEALSSTVTVRTVRSQPWLVNLLPFGAGQFQQGRMGWGVTFAVSQGVLAVVSIISFFALNALFEPVTYTWNDRLTADGSGVFSVTVRRIPPARRTEADVWRALQRATGAGFYALWALGIGDAFWHHQPETVEETQAPARPAPAGLRLQLFPSNGGLGAGVQYTF